MYVSGTFFFFIDALYLRPGFERVYQNFEVFQMIIFRHFLFDNHVWLCKPLYNLEWSQLGDRRAD